MQCRPSARLPRRAAPPAKRPDLLLMGRRYIYRNIHYHNTIPPDCRAPRTNNISCAARFTTARSAPSEATNSLTCRAGEKPNRVGDIKTILARPLAVYDWLMYNVGRCLSFYPRRSFSRRAATTQFYRSLFEDNQLASRYLMMSCFSRQ